MLFFENASFGKEGLNTHVMSWVMAISLSNFIDCDFYFEHEIPCSTPPDYATRPEFRGKYGALLTSERSLVSDLVVIPNRRVLEIDRTPPNKLELQLLESYFGTTEAVKARHEDNFIWNAFSVGRLALTREFLASHDLVEWTHTKLSSPALFYLLPREEKLALMESVRVIYRADIERLATRIIDQLGHYYAIHVRMGDFLKTYAEDEYSIDPTTFGKYLDRVFPDREKPILVATDALQEKAMFSKMLDGYKVVFIDELIFDAYRDAYNGLDFTDFNVLTIINQLICAAAEAFVGTYRSTFTGIIHRLRQERYARRDFHYFPDGKITRMLDESFELKPASSGFFDWNRFPQFSETHNQMAWMREWDHQNSMIDL